jgi:hypothetical protein
MMGKEVKDLSDKNKVTEAMALVIYRGLAAHQQRDLLMTISAMCLRTDHLGAYLGQLALIGLSHVLLADAAQDGEGFKEVANG